MIQTEQIIADLNRIYGAPGGAEVFRRIMPGVLADFQKMLAAAPAGQAVSEEYRTEDGKAAIRMSGIRDGKGTVNMKAIVL